MTRKQACKGEKITVTFDLKKCIHSRNCVLGLPKVFRAGEKAWIKPDEASPDDIAALIRNCPSGALTFERHDGGQPESPPEVNTVRIQENGPLTFHGDLHIGKHEPRIRATLCRCGASKNKPYCDGRHKEIKFRATGELESQDSEQLEARNGPVNISPLKDGPLMAEGNMEIIAGSGSTVKKTKKAALCRCGASKNKPFCDGSHRYINFMTK